MSLSFNTSKTIGPNENMFTVAESTFTRDSNDILEVTIAFIATEILPFKVGKSIQGLRDFIK